MCQYRSKYKPRKCSECLGMHAMAHSCPQNLACFLIVVKKIGIKIGPMRVYDRVVEDPNVLIASVRILMK